jgi:hypothetical protein
VLRVVAWGLGLFLIVLCVLYTRLLFGPISLNFLSDRAQAMITSAVPETYSVSWDDIALSLDGPMTPVIRFSPVAVEDSETGGIVRMAALEVGVSPVWSMVGRPGAIVTLIEPHIQMTQDLFGPRLSNFEMIPDPETGVPTIRVMEGESRQPVIRIREQGLSLAASRSDVELDTLRSDNDWLIYNLESANQSLADIAEQAQSGTLARLRIRDGRVGIHDSVYGLYKEFTDLSVDMRSGREAGRVYTTFETLIAGRRMAGNLTRSLDGDVALLEADVDAIDFSTIIPFLDDAEGMAAVRGSGTLDLAVTFGRESGEIETARFDVDMTGTRLRLDADHFPVSTVPFTVEWFPEEARFHFADIDLGIGESRARVTGDLVLGMDRQFGPTFGMSVRASDVRIQPYDMGPPQEPLDEVTFEGWSAPLYGALGIDRMVAAREGVAVVVQGRIDALREGVGLDLTVGGRGASADDLKRLWPYLFAPEARDLFVEHVIDGQVHSADMRLNFPVGSIAKPGEHARIPDGAMQIELVGSDVELRPFEGLPQFAVEGQTRVSVRDNQFTMGFERAIIADPAGDIEIANAAFLNQDTSLLEQVFEISGDVSGSVPALVKVANREPLDLLKDFQLGYDLDALANDVAGETAATVIATIAMDESGQMVGTDYALNGTVSDLRTIRDIEGFSVGDTQLSYTASQEGFLVVGSGSLQGVPVDVQATKNNGSEPEILLATTVSAADARSFGLDVSEYMGGQVRVVAKPIEDGSFQLVADLADASLTLSDIGVSKARGTPGEARATIRVGDDEISVSEVGLEFGEVRLAGDISLGSDGTFRTAEFSTFRISQGDNAQVALAPINGGYAIDVRGSQLDIKPVLKRFFDLEGGANGSDDAADDQTFNVRVNLDRALGFYGTAAFDVDLDLSIRGSEIRRVNLNAGMGGSRRVSATTNPDPTGRVMTYASNDIGTLLRFVGVYPRLVGGDGSLVMRYDQPSRTDSGAFQMRNFAIVDEENVAEVIGTHSDSQRLIARGNRLDFTNGQATFYRRADRIEVLDASLHGDSVGGTIRGNIYTDEGRYDLAGTYVPLFGLNNAFAQIPLLGPIFGGRNGEGLLGVTFAVRGPLANPDLMINPVSVLAPGIFRSLFEYRAEAAQAAR